MIYMIMLVPICVKYTCIHNCFHINIYILNKRIGCFLKCSQQLESEASAKLPLLKIPVTSTFLFILVFYFTTKAIFNKRNMQKACKLLDIIFYRQFPTRNVPRAENFCALNFFSTTQDKFSVKNAKLSMSAI